jgi:hypothetical protein
MSSNHDLKPLFEKVNEMTLATQYEQAANVIAQFLEDSGEALTRTERFHLRGVRCFCLYHNRDYELARDTVIELIQEREREGALDLNYLHEVEVLALTRRGLCQFDECIDCLNRILKQLRQISDPPAQVTEMISELEKQIEETHKIIGDEPVDELTIHRIEEKGLFGTQTLGVADLEIPKDQAALSCQVHQLAFSFQNLNRFSLEMEFSLDNQLAIESWPIRSHNTPPILLVLVLPRGAKVHHGDFEIRLAGKEGAFSNRGVRLENHFFTIVHPDSYHPRSKHPIPICKTFRYVKADCSVFWSPIPPRARIRLNGSIEFSQKSGDCKEQTIIRKLWLLFPYGHVSLPRPEFRPVEGDDFEFVSATLVRTAFHKDQTGFRAGEYIMEGPGPEPIIGAVSPIEDKVLKDRVLNLSDMDMLAVEAKMIPKRAVLATIHKLADVVPLGTFNYLPVLNARKDPNSDEQSFFNLRGEDTELSAEEHRPLATILLENYSAEPRSLRISINCEPLGFHSEEATEIAPWQRVSVPIKPRLDQNAPVFHGWQSSADIAQAIRDCPISLTVLEQREGKRDTSSALISKNSHARVLPPDFMVWTISEPSDGRILDLRLLVARWVTPHAATVVKLMEEIGLQRPTGDPMEDLRRVYDRVAAMRIQYDMSRISVGAEMAYRFQRIRTPTVTLTSRKMNCIDGCVLFASCMESIGYSPIIVFLPEHAIFATILSGSLDAIRSLLLLETTMVCSQANHGPSNYDEALAAGAGQFGYHQEYLFPNKSEQKPSRYSDTGFPLHRIVPLEWARQCGVEPFEDG